VAVTGGKTCALAAGASGLTTGSDGEKPHRHHPDDAGFCFAPEAFTAGVGGEVTAFDQGGASRRDRMDASSSSNAEATWPPQRTLARDTSRKRSELVGLP